MDDAGIPIDIVILIIIVMPICVVVPLGALAFRRMTPLAFHCRHCNRDFCRKAHLRFPVSCPLCRATDWNA